MFPAKLPKGISMLFSSLFFLQIFLPVTYFVSALLKNKSNLFLLIASLFFYSWGEYHYVGVLIFSISINYLIGRFLSHSEGRDRIIVLTFGISSNLLILCYFKYAQFFIENLNLFLPDPIAVAPAPMPVGISFFTFQAISYIIDVYRRQIESERNPISLGLYIAFFPQLIAGPIVKFHDIAGQLNHRQITLSGTAYGIRRFIFGLSKKVILANELALVADSTFNTGGSVSTIAAWLGCIAYTLQIYFDFSGYSDMAIGLGRMFGFHFPENFNYPYLSCSIGEFWRRWHISLSSWFKEYLYIPLGGNKKGELCTQRNLFLVFLATGFWHGASWNFVFWGIYHGFFVMLEKMLEKYSFKRIRLLGSLYVVLTVMIGWVLFRCETLKNAAVFIRAMFLPGEDDANLYFRWLTPYYAGIFIVSVILCGPHQLLNRVKKYTRGERPYVFDLLFLPVLLTLCIIKLGASTYNPFIYFRF